MKVFKICLNYFSMYYIIMSVRYYREVVYAAMAQQAERRLGKAEATGSNPVSSLII